MKRVIILLSVIAIATYIAGLLPNTPHIALLLIAHIIAGAAVTIALTAPKNKTSKKKEYDPEL